MHYTYKFTTALAVIYINSKVPTWHHRDLILLQPTQLMWDPVHWAWNKEGVPSWSTLSSIFLDNWGEHSDVPPSLPHREGLATSAGGRALHGQSICWLYRDFPQISAESCLTQGFAPSTGSPYPTTGWSPGHALINKNLINKYAKLQLRIRFPENRAWCRIPALQYWMQLLSSVFHIFVCAVASTWTLIPQLSNGQNPTPSSRAGSNVPLCSQPPQSVALWFVLPESSAVLKRLYLLLNGWALWQII